jgi:hypothetical protein
MAQGRLCSMILLAGPAATTSLLARLRYAPGRAVRRLATRWRQRRAFRTLSELGVIAYFDGYPPNALQPKYDELLALYLVIQKRKPKVILELGGGYSTFVIAHAVRELHARNCQAIFYSVDQSDHWQQVVKDHMPKDLLPFVRFWRGDPELIELNGETVSIYNSLPVEAANLVFVDGGLVQGNKIGADALLLEQNAPEDYGILIDERRHTVAFLKRTLAHRYVIGKGPTGVHTLFARIPA